MSGALENPYFADPPSVTPSNSMQPDAAALLWDARRAAQLILDFIVDRAWPDYQAEAMLRSAVERQFEIIGEALNRLSRADPLTAAGIEDLPRIVAFRNVLVHGYATIDDVLVGSCHDANRPTDSHPQPAARRIPESLIHELVAPVALLTVKGRGPERPTRRRWRSRVGPTGRGAHPALTSSNLRPAFCSRVSRLAPIAWAVVTWPATSGLSSRARHSADSASIIAVSV